ncbi:hypothetical protein AM1H77_04660 [Apilactobacillus micheneri]
MYKLFKKIYIHIDINTKIDKQVNNLLIFNLFLKINIENIKNNINSNI